MTRDEMSVHVHPTTNR